MISFIAQLVNTALALFLWLIIGRAALQLLIGQRRNFFSEVFRRSTDPLFALVRRVTPPAVADRFIPWLTVALLLALRFALLPVLKIDS